ncbi:unnamed protein product [marine sediment metagenome]|uniref:Uncharacterized protein n=1 Tax=marine sediment metagenome TaxID=412755 RepID=X1AVS1_9ZZZZ
MFNLDEFEQDQVIYPLVEKLNKLLDKNKTEKVEKVINQLEELLVEQEHAISISYILSILAENDFNPNCSISKSFSNGKTKVNRGNNFK